MAAKCAFQELKLAVYSFLLDGFGEFLGIDWPIRTGGLYYVNFNRCFEGKKMAPIIEPDETNYSQGSSNDQTEERLETQIQPIKQHSGLSANPHWSR